MVVQRTQLIIVVCIKQNQRPTSKLFVLSQREDIQNYIHQDDQEFKIESQAGQQSDLFISIILDNTRTTALNNMRTKGQFFF